MIQQLSETDRTVLEMVTLAADAGLPCPTNNEMSCRLGFKSVSGPINALERLQRRGLIVVERFHMERRVTIVATGNKTKVFNDKPHWRDVPEHQTAEKFPPMPKKRDYRGRPLKFVPTAEELLNMPRVSRDPCFHCGARGDAGCGCASAHGITILRFPQGAR